MDISLSDPCNCSDPLNVLVPQGQQVQYFHDVLSFVLGISGATISTTSVDGNFLNSTGTMLGSGTLLVEDINEPGTYRVDFWRPVNSGSFAMTFNVSGTDPNIGEVSLVVDACGLAADSCLAAIPSMGTWAILILGLLFCTFAVIKFNQRAKQKSTF